MLSKIHKGHIFFALSGAFIFFLFTVFTLLVRENLFTTFDFDTTHRLQNQTPLRFDPIFSSISVIGRFEYTVIFLVLILLLYRKIWGIIAFGLFGFAHVIELIGKTFLDHPGPPRMFLRSHYSDFPGLHVYTDGSYPSGHSLRSVFLAILLIFLIYRSNRINPLLKIALYFVIVSITGIMLYSRVSLGEHWTTDVIGGTLLGASMAAFSLVFLSKPKSSPSSINER